MNCAVFQESRLGKCECQLLGGSVYKTLMRPDEAARLLHVSRWTIYRWVGEGRLDGTRVGPGSLRIFADSVDRLILRNRIGEPAGNPAKPQRAEVRR
ncbi:MAG: excisionase family DNA-binding protein [Candidatus Methylacidiphilaceae bacterium]